MLEVYFSILFIVNALNCFFSFITLQSFYKNSRFSEKTLFNNKLLQLMPRDIDMLFSNINFINIVSWIYFLYVKELSAQFKKYQISLNKVLATFTMSDTKHVKKEDQAFKSLEDEDFIIQGLCDDQSNIIKKSSKSFKSNYQIIALQSKVRELEMDKRKLVIFYDNELQSQKQYILELEKYKQSLLQQKQYMQIEIQQFKFQINNLSQQNQLLALQIQGYLQKQSESKQTQIYKTKSENKMPFPSIKKNSKNRCQYFGVIRNVLDAEVEKLRQKDKNPVHQQKNFKHNDETIQQSKEIVIKKLASMSSQSSIRQISEKNQIIQNLQKQLNKYFHLLKEEKAISKNLQQKLDNQQSTKKDSNNLKLFSSMISNSIFITDSDETDDNQQLNLEENIKKQNYTTVKSQVKASRKQLQQIINELQNLKYNLQKQIRQQSKQITLMKQLHNVQMQKIEQKLQIAERNYGQTIKMLPNDKKQRSVQKKSKQLQQFDLYNLKVHEKAEKSLPIDEMLQISIIKQKSQQNQAIINLQKQNLRLKVQNISLKKFHENFNTKYKDKQQKKQQSIQKKREQYNQQIQHLEKELVQLTKYKQACTQIFNKNEINTQNNTEIKKQLERLRLSNQQFKLQKKQKIEKISKMEKNSELGYRQLLKMYNDLQQQYENEKKKYQTEIEEINQQLSNEKKKNSLKKIQYKKNEDKLNKEVKQLWNIINGLKQVQNWTEDNYEMNQLKEKIERLTQQIIVITEEKESMSKANELILKDKCKSFEDEKEKINEYVRQLEQRCEILIKKTEQGQYENQKLVNILNEMKIFEEKLKSLQRDNYKLRIELSETKDSLKESLQKHKKLEQKLKDCLSQQQITRQKYNNLHQKYCQLCHEKSKQVVKLDNCYDQIQRLNKLLVYKQQYLARNRVQSQWQAYSPTHKCNRLQMSPRQRHNSPSQMPKHSNRFSKLEIQSLSEPWLQNNHRSLVSPQQGKINKQIKIQKYFGANITDSKHSHPFI